MKPSDAAKGVLTGKLAELGFKVIQSRSSLDYSPSEAQQDTFRKANDCNLVFLISGDARKMSKLGNFWSFQGAMKGKILNLTTHQVIAETAASKRGQRKLAEDKAAVSALEAAGGQLAADLTEALARKGQAASLVKLELIVTRVKTRAKAEALRTGLVRLDGIYYAAVHRWDETSAAARYELLCPFYLESKIADYVVQIGTGRVKSVSRKGN